MTNDTQPTGDRQPSPAAPAGAATCSQNQEHPNAMPIDVRRMMGLDIAAKLVGGLAIAEEMGIGIRALSYKIAGDRGTSDADMLAAVRVIERQAAKLLTHAHKLRVTVGQSVSQTLDTPLPIQIASVLAYCEQVERFGYDRIGFASPGLLSAAARRLAEACISESTKTPAPAVQS